jgi:hypothetical protein
MSDAESYVSVNEASNVVKLREMDDQQSTSSGPSSSQSQSSGCSRVELPIKLRPLTIDVSTVPREGEEGGGGGVHLSHTTMKQNGSISLGHHHHSSTNGGSKMMSDGHETPQSEACCFLNEASAEAKLLKKRISLPGSHPKTAVPTENPSSLVAKQQQQQLNGPGSEPPSMVLQQKKNGLSAVIKAQRYHI